MTSWSHGVVEITPVVKRDGSVVYVDDTGRIWWTEGVPKAPVAKKAPTRARKWSKRMTIDSFRESKRKAA